MLIICVCAAAAKQDQQQHAAAWAAKDMFQPLHHHDDGSLAPLPQEVMGIKILREPPLLDHAISSLHCIASGKHSGSSEKETPHIKDE